ncbi:hypothetical protein FHU23_000248 [Clostridium saccharobutylicum]|uniref:Uncharacterized protein n=1 Tax=Clostridium saccharobutylicum DSM 13864 TaxID=1345695 RepID=U5MZ39_CLOSA|nr:hypothetical protein [Clostridium saccharobutylicum]AGX44787.1 hypothetical protein CLSA_c38270 [Clostridium saccharobutylicum DSM 13864]MBA2903572.1 hypothetical protein [Clostridium saccharobutylicum]MBA8894909.1 hypothetical protein [Clostridium saccharobutylicum]MBA8984184.1 hypothetical protein [Clostridium saccharobutylicum]MBA8997245.1 hypothetical protein [Clostridium saccharobutylicum]
MLYLRYICIFYENSNYILYSYNNKNKFRNLVGFCIYSTKEEVIISAQEVDVINDELRKYANNLKET